jgi:hypothetical protein
MPGHVESESNPWSINIPDHAQRADSPEFQHAKDVAHKIMATISQPWHRPGPWQMHHGGSLWVFDGKDWHLYLNDAGIEWSSQFCADPARIDVLRQNAERLIAAFPKTEPELIRLGYKDTSILHTPITDAVGVGRFVDSIFNSCVPLAAAVHTGVLSSKNTTGGGEHHYPKPITDIQHFKRSDFILWVVDPQSNQRVAVTPVAPRGSGDGRVKVAWAPPERPSRRNSGPLTTAEPA